MTVAEREEKRRLTKIKELTYFTEARNHFFDRLRSYTGEAIDTVFGEPRMGYDSQVRDVDVW